jgi:predicted nucleotidyltransferase
MFGLSENIINQINGVLACFPEVEEAILYGSRAKGNYREGSDIDLTLKGALLTEDIRGKIWWTLDDLSQPYMIDLSIYHRINNPDLIYHIDRVGQLFYKKQK